MRCDEARPGCKRCSTHGVACPGYRAAVAGGIEFRDQTSITVQRAKNQQKPKGVDDVAKNLSLVRAKPGGSYIPFLGDELLHRMTMPATILSPTAFRSQLYSEFIDIYLPRTPPGTLDDHFSFFKRLATMPTEHPALLESLDALSLVTVGNQNKDPTLLNLSVRTYGRALNSLGKAISRCTGDDVNSDDLLATTSVLATCALYDEIGQHADGWGQHVKGCQQLIAARKPESIQSELSLLLFTNTRHSAFCFALIERKAPLLARPDWRAVALKSPIQDVSILFYDTAIQIPGMLERYDSLISDPLLASLDSYAVLSSLDEILHECQRLDSELREWYSSWKLYASLGEAGSTTTADGNLYHETSIDDFPTFTSLCIDRTFDTAFMFASFPIAYLSSIYWICLHFLRTTIQSLHTLRNVVDQTWYPEPHELVSADELLEYVFNLCKCIPYFCEPISSTTGQIGSFLPMRTAAIYFTSYGHWKYAKWIGAIRDSIFVKGLSPPNVKDPPDMVLRLASVQAEDWRKAFYQCNRLHSSSVVNGSAK